MRLERREILPNISRLQAAGPEEVSTGLDLWQIVDFLRRRWKIIALCGLLALAIAFVYVQTRTPLYASASEMLLQARGDSALSHIISKDAANQEQGAIDGPELENQIFLIQSVALLRRVVEREKLVDDPEYGPGQPSLFAKITAPLLRTINSILSPPAPTSDGAAAADSEAEDDPVTNTARVLRGFVSADRSGKSSGLLISAFSQNPDKAARIANAVAAAYVEEQLANRIDAANRGSAWLSGSLSSLREQLKQSEEAVAKFRADNNLTSAIDNGATLTEQQLSQLNSNLVAAQTDTAEKRAKLEQAELVRQNKGNAQAIPDVLRSGVIGGLRSSLTEVSRKEADLVARYGAQHPLVVNVRAERRDLEGALNAEIARILQVLKNDYDVSLARQRSLENSLAGLTGQRNVNDQTAVKLRELERTAAANKTLYEDFLTRAKMLEEQEGFRPTEARVLTQAVPSSTPAFPRKGLALALGLFCGLGLGFAAAVGMELMNAGFTSPRQVEEILDLPVLACLALLKPGKTQNGAPPAFAILDKPLSRYSEAIRSLRNAVNLHFGKVPPKVIQVTSAMPQEGKSTVSLSMALSAADSGQRVLLIDADLRRPSVTESFGLGTHRGLSDVLAGAVRVSEAVHIDERSGLHVLAAGSKTKNPPALLGSESMRILVDGLARHFDLLIIDTPPLGPVVDGVIVSQISDTIVFVVKWSHTAREAVEASIKSLPDRRNVAGVVLNLVDEAKIAKFGKYAFYGYSEFAKYYQE